jgi:hypothetical protein
MWSGNVGPTLDLNGRNVHQGTKPPIIIKTLLYSRRRRYLLLVISSLLPIWDYALSDMAYSHVYGIMPFQG